MQENNILIRIRTFFLEQKKMISVFFVFVSLFGITFFFSDIFFVNKIQNDLKKSKEILFDVNAIKGREKNDEKKRLLLKYKQNILNITEDVKKIKSQTLSQNISREIFEKLSSHFSIFSSIQSQIDLFGSPFLDEIRDVNILAQEDAIERISLDEEEMYIQDQNSKTLQKLKCPNCNVVLISLTTLRKDRMGIYGYEKSTTPNIDNFFKDALRFDSTIAPSSWTTPNAVSLFTSLMPYRHGIMRRDPTVLYNRKVMTLPEILIKNGYKTGGFTGGGDYNSKFSGVKRGFYTYLDETSFKEMGIENYSLGGGGTLRYAKLSSFLPVGTRWLDENKSSKFFLFLQGYDTHCPLDPREPFASKFLSGLQSDFNFSYCHWTHEDVEPSYENGKKYWNVQIPVDKEEGKIYIEKFFQSDMEYMNALYDARVAEMDFYLNNFFEKVKSLGLEKNTVFILMSDHGEMLGEHGRFMRGGSIRGTMYEQAIGFPLLIKHPQIKEPIIVNDVVQTVDLMPTILSLLGVRDPQANIREGKALEISSFGDQPTNQYGFGGVVYSPLFVNDIFSKKTEANIVRNDVWKLMKDTIYEGDDENEVSISYKLFNLKDDPDENINLYDTEKEEAEKLKSQLEQWLDNYR